MNLPEYVNVPFSLAAPGARSVSVAIFLGDRTQPPARLSRTHRPALSAEVVSLREVKPGCWSVELPLQPGWCEYSFLVDGAWTPDPEAPVTWPDDFGDVNSFRLVVAAPNVQPAPSARNGEARRSDPLLRAV